MRAPPHSLAALLVVAGVLSACANPTVQEPGGGGVERRSSTGSEPLTTVMALRNVIAAAETYRLEHGDSYEGLGPRQLADVWGGVCYQRDELEAGDCQGDFLVVNVASSASRFGAAALDEHNVCLWITQGPSGLGYGSGRPCDGRSAMEADDRRFPASV